MSLHGESPAWPAPHLWAYLPADVQGEVRAEGAAAAAARLLVRYEFDPVWESVGQVAKYEGEARTKALVEAYTAQRTSAEHAARAAAPPRHDAALDERARQGLAKEQPHARAPLDAKLWSYVHLHQDPVDPDKDRAATGAYFLVLSTGAAADSSAAPQCEAYDPAGKYIGSVPQARAQQLLARYHAHMQATGGGVTAPGFARELALLIQRYRQPRRRAPRGPKAKPGKNWVLPPAYMAALQQALGISTERFASPLDVHPETACYFSMHPQDAVFGATTDAFSCPWVGAGQVHPAYDHDTLEKAMRWAIAAATHADLTDAPVYNVLVLPRWDKEGSSYHRWLQHPAVQVLAEMSRSCTPFTDSLP
ncbi:MAG: hypothetical protein ACRC1H_06920, partial [Caldilineaceae bacterium]